MGLLFDFIILTASGWILSKAVSRLSRDRASTFYWAAFAILIVIGAAIGVWCVFVFEYKIGLNMRIGGFPIPIVFFHFEDGQWVDFPVSEAQARLTVVTDISATMALAVLPLWVIFSRLHARQKS